MADPEGKTSAGRGARVRCLRAAAEAARKYYAAHATGLAKAGTGADDFAQETLLKLSSEYCAEGPSEEGFAPCEWYGKGGQGVHCKAANSGFLSRLVSDLWKKPNKDPLTGASRYLEEARRHSEIGPGFSAAGSGGPHGSVSSDDGEPPDPRDLGRSDRRNSDAEAEPSPGKADESNAPFVVGSGESGTARTASGLQKLAGSIRLAVAGQLPHAAGAATEAPSPQARKPAGFVEADSLVHSDPAQSLARILQSFLFEGILPDVRKHIAELKLARDVLLATLSAAGADAWEAGARLDECAGCLRTASPETVEAVSQDLASLCAEHIRTCAGPDRPTAGTKSTPEQQPAGDPKKSGRPMTAAERKCLQRLWDRQILSAVGGQELRFLERLDEAADDAAYLCLRLLDEAARHGIKGRSKVEDELGRAWKTSAPIESRQVMPQGLGPAEAAALAHLILARVLKCLFPGEYIKGTKVERVLPVWLTTLATRAIDLPKRVNLSAMGLSPDDYEKTVQEILQHERMPAIGLSRLVGGGRELPAQDSAAGAASPERSKP